MKEIAGEGEEAGEAVFGIDVFVDDVEGEIVETAKTPDADGEQCGGLEGGAVEKEQSGGGEADEQEEEAFELDPERVGKVAHGWDCSMDVHFRKTFNVQRPKKRAMDEIVMLGRTWRKHVKVGKLA